MGEAEVSEKLSEIWYKAKKKHSVSYFKVILTVLSHPPKQLKNKQYNRQSERPVRKSFKWLNVCTLCKTSKKVETEVSIRGYKLVMSLARPPLIELSLVIQ